MNTFSYQDNDYDERLAKLLERTAFSADIDAGVAAIIADVTARTTAQALEAVQSGIAAGPGGRPTLPADQPWH